MRPDLSDSELLQRLNGLATEVEQATLGALLLDGRSLSKLATLTDQHWSRDAHSEIFAAIGALALKGIPTDAVTVGDHLPNMRAYLIELANNSPGSANIEAYAASVVKYWRIRSALGIASTLRGSMLKADEDGIDAALVSLMDLSRVERTAEWSVNDALLMAYRQLEYAVEHPGELRGVTSGLDDLDECLGGFHPGDLVILGARPAMGKTAGMLSMAAAASIAGPAGIISAEQPAVQIGQRLLSQASKVAAKKLRTGRLDDLEWPKISAGMEKLVSRHLHIYDRSAPDVAEVARVARKWHHKYGIKALYVDYLQRINWTDMKLARHERVGEVARALKNLARDLNIPVLALAQVKREVEQRSNKRPTMGDLADSGEIEKEADQIIMLYRGEVYDDDSCPAGTAELIVEKNRHGSTGTTAVAWLGETMQLANLTTTPRSWP